MGGFERMKLWTADKKSMWYGASGWHYHASLSCPQSRDITAERLKRFYIARRGVLSEPAADGHIRFSRGKIPWSWLTRSETWQPQTVDITLSQEARVTNVAIHYHVTNRFGLVVAPCMFDREIQSLRVELEAP